MQQLVVYIKHSRIIHSLFHFIKVSYKCPSEPGNHCLKERPPSFLYGFSKVVLGTLPKSSPWTLQFPNYLVLFPKLDALGVFHCYFSVSFQILYKAKCKYNPPQSNFFCSPPTSVVCWFNANMCIYKFRKTGLMQWLYIMTA